MSKERFTTPFCECLYPFLQMPKVDRDGNYPEVFQINLILTQEHKDLLNQISSLYKDAGGKAKIGDRGHPIKFHKDEEDNIVPDTFTVKFQTKADFCDHIETFDALGQRFNREQNFVANGSIVRVNWSFGYYDHAGNKGVSLYLNGVQVKELIEWEGHTAESFGFDTTEGYNEYKDFPQQEEFSEAEKAIAAPSGPGSEESGGGLNEKMKKIDEKREEDNAEEDDLPF